MEMSGVEPESRVPEDVTSSDITILALHRTPVKSGVFVVTLFGLEIKFVIPLFHLLNHLHVLPEAHVLEVLIGSLHLTDKQEEIGGCDRTPTQIIVASFDTKRQT